MSINISDINNSNRIIQKNLPDANINLKNGEIIRGTVVGKNPEGGMLVSLDGKQLSAVTSLSLPIGSKQLFQVSVIDSKIELKLLGSAAPKSDLSSATVSSSVPKDTMTNVLSELKTVLDQAGLGKAIDKLANNLRQIMPMIVYANPKDHNGAWIKENILASGLLWENKLIEALSDEKNISIKKLLKGDLKGILLSLQKGLLAEGEGDESLTVKLKQALGLIEGNQQINLSALEQELGWLFFIPGREEDGFNGAEVFIKKKNDKSETYFSVLLDFTALGRFEANVAMMGHRTSIRILMDDEKKTKIVNDNLPLLEKGLRALGIKELNVSCDVRKGYEPEERIISGIKKRTQAVSIIV
jgi:hypothetical protein